MKFFIALLFLSVQFTSYSQGTLLNLGESGTYFGYSSGQLSGSSDGSSDRFHSAYFGFAIQRKLEFEIEKGTLDGRGLFGIGISGYLNIGQDMGLKAGYVYSKYSRDGFEAVKALSATVFFASQESYSKLVPRFGIIVTADRETSFSIGVDMLFGNKSAGLRAGVSLLIDGSDSTVVTFSVGTLFTQRVRKKLPLK